jgi:hypothetical protein
MTSSTVVRGSTGSLSEEWETEEEIRRTLSVVELKPDEDARIC